MFTKKKIAIVSVINDLVTDNRVNKTCFMLLNCGYSVKLIGRKLPDSLPLPQWPFRSMRLRMLFRQGPLFYFFFNLRLFFVLLVAKADLFYANDLDTLLPNYLVSRLKGKALIYDSHELFTEVPELQHAPLKKRIWERIEAWLIPKLRTCITVNQSIADVFSRKYQTKFHVIRNIPANYAIIDLKSKTELGIPLDKKILLLQGAGINKDRGAEELLEAMRDVEGAVLYIIGSGDSWPLLSRLIDKWELAQKVVLKKKIPKTELNHYTAHADLGLSIDKDTNLNYYYSLPNKLFDYIHAGVPVLASRLPEIENIIQAYRIGDFISDHKPKHIASKINHMLNSDALSIYKKNTQRAKLELNWETEKIRLQQIILNAT